MRLQRLLLSLTLALVVVCAAPSPGQAQTYGPPTDYVAWSVAPTTAATPPGGPLWLAFKAEIDAPWKMYALDATLPGQRPQRPYGIDLLWEAIPDGFVQEGAFSQATPKVGFDAGFNMDLGYFLKQAEVAAPFLLNEDVVPGAHVISGNVRFQICRDDVGICLRPGQAPFEVTVQVDPAGTDGVDPFLIATTGTAGQIDLGAGTNELSLGGRSDAAGADAAARIEVPVSDYDAARAGGLWGFLLLAMGAGLAALLTPCVFPMIPLTVSYFTKHANDRRQAVRMAGVYGASIVLTFTGLGVIMALVVGATGAQVIAANPWVNLFIAAVLIFFGLSLLGLFELRLPTNWLNYVNRQGQEQSGYAGVLFMGLTLTLVSFSCTAPFVGGLMAATAGGAWTLPLFGMLVFSATFALPFILFALFPRALNALPRSGSWMQAVKVVLGFVELAAALKFLSNADLIWGWSVLSRPLAIALTVVIFFLTGLYLIGKLQLMHEARLEQVGVLRLLFAILFFGTSLYMMPGLLGAPLNALDAYLPPRQGTDVSLVAALPAAGGASLDEGWIQDDLEAAFAQAAAEERPIFMDFTGYTCTNCRAMEANIFPRAPVAERFARDFVLLRLYTDDLEKGEALAQYQLKLTASTALPTYAIVDPDGRLIAKESGMMDVEELVAFLDRGAQRYAQNMAAR